MTLHAAAAWFPLGVLLAVLVLCAIAGARLAGDARGLLHRARTLSVPKIDSKRTLATLEKLHEDALVLSILLERAGDALSQIDRNLRELAQSPAANAMRAMMRARAPR